MKTVFLALFFFLLVLATVADTVLDTDGKPVINNGSQYYMLPAIRGTGGGGFTLTRAGQEKCPVTMMQASSELSNGLPVRISSTQGKKIIKTGWYVDIQFVKVPRCTPKPSIWKIPPDSYFVKIRDDKRFSSDFMIEKASEDGAYKIMHCPFHPRSCMEVGIVFDEERNRRLRRTGQNPLIVRFKKATAQN